MSKNRIAGTCYLKVDGTQYSLKGGLKVSPNDIEREGVAGMDGVHGYIEKPRVPSIEADLSDLGGLSLDALMKITDATITVELANGKAYTLRNAWTKGPHDLDAGEGTVSVTFEGLKCEEIKS